MNFFLKIRDFIYRRQLNATLEIKVFNVLCLIVVLLTFVVVFFNTLKGIPAIMSIAMTCFGGISALFFYLSIFKNINKFTPILFLLCLGVILCFLWITSEGVLGATPSIFSTIVIIGIYISKRQHSFLVFLFYVLLMFGLLVLQFFAPQCIQSYANRNVMIQDITITFVISMIGVGALVLLLKRNYEREHQKIDQQRLMFEQMNEELKVHFDLNQQQSEEITCTLEEIQIQKAYIETQNEQLEQKNFELNELIATKDKFLSIIGHDLKNPISAIIGFSELLSANAEKYDPKKIEQFSKIINDSSKHIFELLDNLLTWARCQTGKIKYNPEPMSIDILIDSVLLLLSDFAKRKDIDIVLAKRSNAKVLCDGNMIDTVLRNLISNSIKFTPVGGKIEISVQVNDEFVLVSVSDNGVGMTHEQLDKMFKLGEQRNTAGTNNEPGTGLGLFLCKEFLLMHGSDLQIHSTVAVGSTFSYALKTV